MASDRSLHKVNDGSENAQKLKNKFKKTKSATQQFFIFTESDEGQNEIVLGVSKARSAAYFWVREHRSSFDTTT